MLEGPGLWTIFLECIDLQDRADLTPIVFYARLSQRTNNNLLLK